ncbi:U8-agatoxin-Ao1a-like [Centruroides vittatus]|uniref:U8-agatoxin-Ao1a-like n=1 Tax=Centruroides sculpturatus TaxID=218467 RepID=UPI000C6EDE9F|nr:U8-agatoxin-Ao1a-like [Centruroides sculpturatus]
MKHSAVISIVLILILAQSLNVMSYYGNEASLLDDYNDGLARFLFFTRKRSCIRRGGSCDHRPHDCCFSSSCRCNLWGTNCRCQRPGLFQKLGK